MITTETTSAAGFTGFTEDQVAELLCCAYEGGSNYWAVQNDGKASPYKIEMAGLRDDFDFVTITDVADCHRRTYRLDHEALARGLGLLPTKSPAAFAALLTGNEDAGTGDVFLQCCLFGELIYG